MCDGVVLVTDAVPLDGHRVAVRFSDGYSGVLDMAKYFSYPAFAGLNDPAVRYCACWSRYGVVG